MDNVEKILSIKIKLENANTVQELEEVLTDIKETMDEIGEAEGLEELEGMAEKATKELDETQEAMTRINAQTGKLEQGMGALNDIAGQLGLNLGMVSKTMKTAESFTRLFGVATNKAATGTGLMSKALKILKVAIASTGIGVLVLALGSLVSYFTNTQRGADKLSQAFAYMGAAIDVIKDRLSSIGEALYNLFVERDWAAFKDQVSGAFKGIGDEIKKESAEAAALERQMQKVIEKERALKLLQADRNIELQKLKLLVEENIDDQAKAMGLLQKAMAIQNKISADEIALLEEKRDIIKKQVAQGESMNATLDDEVDAQIAVKEARARSSEQLRELTARYLSLQKALKSAKDAEQAEAVVEDFEPPEDEEDQEMLDMIERGHQLKLYRENMIKLEAELEEQAFQDKIETEEWRAKKLIELEKTTREQRLQLAQGLYQDLKALSQTFFDDTEEGQKKAFEFNKMVSTAEAIVQTYLSASKAYTSQLIPGDPTSIVRAQIAAGLAVASGIARVATIQRTKFNSSSVEDTPVNNTLPSSSFNNAQPQMPTLDLGGRGQEKIKVYVSETDIAEATKYANSIYNKAVVTG